MKSVYRALLVSILAIICSTTLACSSDPEPVDTAADSGTEDTTRERDVVPDTGSDTVLQDENAEDTDDAGEDGSEVEEDGDQPDGEEPDGDLSEVDGSGSTITPSEGGTLTSVDGGLSIAFPSGAVSGETEVTATPVALSDVPWSAPSDSSGIRAYHLEPDGLLLDEAATLTFTRSLDDHVHEDEPGEYRAMVVLSYSESAPEPGIEVLGVTDEDGTLHLRTQIDLVNGEVNAIAEISHFSWVVVIEADVAMSYLPGDVNARDGETWPTRLVFNNHSDNTYEIQYIRKSVDLPATIHNYRDIPEDNRNPVAVDYTIHFGFDELWLDSAYLEPEGRSEWRDSPWLECNLRAWDIAFSDPPPERSEVRIIANLARQNFDRIHQFVVLENFWFYHQLPDSAIDLEFDLVTEVSCVAAPEGATPRCDPTNPQTEALTDFGENLGLTEADLCAAMVNLLGVDDQQPTQHSAGEGEADPGDNGPTHSLARGAIHTDLSESEISDAFTNTFYPCGEGDEAFTVCHASEENLSEGDYIVAYHILEAPVPLNDGTNHYQYGFVFDSDGEDTNNYDPALPYDFYKGSDRWYEVVYTPDAGWILTVSDSEFSGTSGLWSESVEVESDARIIIDGPLIALVVPSIELNSSNPSYRVTAFRHTGDWGHPDPFDWRLVAPSERWAGTI